MAVKLHLRSYLVQSTPDAERSALFFVPRQAHDASSVGRLGQSHAGVRWVVWAGSG